jgi:hypothetical protein
LYLPAPRNRLGHRPFRPKLAFRFHVRGCCTQKCARGIEVVCCGGCDVDLGVTLRLNQRLHHCPSIGPVLLHELTSDGVRETGSPIERAPPFRPGALRDAALWDRAISFMAGTSNSVHMPDSRMRSWRCGSAAGARRNGQVGTSAEKFGRTVVLPATVMSKWRFRRQDPLPAS